MSDNKMNTPSRIGLVDAESQALVYAQQVFAGAKLAATLQVKSELASNIQAACEREKCRVLIDGQDGWAYIWIYKYPFVRLLIDEVKKRGAPKSALDTWVNGKLFGYSDYEIARALDKEGTLNRRLRKDPNKLPVCTLVWIISQRARRNFVPLVQDVGALDRLKSSSIKRSKFFGARNGGSDSATSVLPLGLRERPMDRGSCQDLCYR